MRVSNSHKVTPGFMLMTQESAFPSRNDVLIKDRGRLTYDLRTRTFNTRRSLTLRVIYWKLICFGLGNIVLRLQYAKTRSRYCSAIAISVESNAYVLWCVLCVGRNCTNELSSIKPRGKPTAAHSHRTLDWTLDISRL